MKIRTLDSILYLGANVGIFIAGFRGLLIWVCVCGFILLDEALTILFADAYRKTLKQKAGDSHD